MTGFGERLRQARGTDSQASFARKLGISQVAYSRYELNQREPGLDCLYQIGVITGISLDWLLGLSEDNSRKSSAAAELLDNSPEKAVESGVKTSSAGALNAAEKGVDCATCKYRLFAEAFKALQPPA